jgi:hypothetical protein
LGHKNNENKLLDFESSKKRNENKISEISISKKKASQGNQAREIYEVTSVSCQVNLRMEIPYQPMLGKTETSNDAWHLRAANTTRHNTFANTHGDKL